MPEDETLEQEAEQQEPEDIRVLRKKAKKADEYLTRAEKAERTLALRDAGIPNSKLGQLFEKGYDGDWADVEAIKAAAVDYGVLEPLEPDTSTDEAQTIQRVEQASNGATADPGIDYAAEALNARTEDEFYATYAKSGRPLANRG